MVKLLSIICHLFVNSTIMFQAEAGLVPTTEFLTLAEQFTNEANYTVWNDLTANLSNLAKLLQNTEFYFSFQAFCVKLFEEIASKVGWDPKEGEGEKCYVTRERSTSFLASCWHKGDWTQMPGRGVVN